MLAYLVLLLAVLSRILPHSFHAVSWNFTAIGGGLLFFGSKMRDSRSPAWMTAVKLGSALAALIATDYYLTVFAFGYAFHPAAYLVTWLWYAAVCLLGMGLLQKPSVLKVAAGVLASATSFFVLSNFAVWAGEALYPRSLAGLASCYTAAIPFYRNDLVSTALVATTLFGLPVLATKIEESLVALRDNQQPLA